MSDSYFQPGEDIYHFLTAVDDLAFAALKISLSEPERTVVIDRLRNDWMSDVGVVGVLRRQHVLTRSIEEPARTYWLSRREPLSPRIESLLASLLMNLASSLCYDVLKELISAGYDVSKLLADRGIDRSVIGGLVEQIDVFVAHVRTFLALHRAKQDAARADEIRHVVKEVLAGQELKVQEESVKAALELLMSNLRPAIRGIIVERLKSDRIYVDTNANGVLTRGTGVSAGVGYGAPASLNAEKCISLSDKSVLLIEGRADPSAIVLIEASAAVVTWGCNEVSHVPVMCRGIGRPAVIVTKEEADMLLRRKFLVVDGSAGLIRSFRTQPKDLNNPY